MTDAKEAMKTTHTHFVQPAFALEHAGAERLTRALEGARRAASKLGSPAGMASVLMIAGLSAIIVVAEQVVSAWTNGHLLAAWIALWLIVFGLLAMFSDAIRAWPVQWQSYILARRQAAAERAADGRMWDAALADPRLMADLDCALLRAEQHATATGQPMPRSSFAGARTRPNRETATSSAINPAAPLKPSRAGADAPLRHSKADWGPRAAPFPGMPLHLQYLSD